MVAIPNLMFLRIWRMRSSPDTPATNWPAMSTIWALTGPATSAGAKEEAARPALSAGFSSTALSPRYSCRCRTISADELSEGSTSTNRNSCVLKTGSFMDQSISRA